MLWKMGVLDILFAVAGVTAAQENENNFRFPFSYFGDSGNAETLTV